MLPPQPHSYIVKRHGLHKFQDSPITFSTTASALSFLGFRHRRPCRCARCILASRWHSRLEAICEIRIGAVAVFHWQPDLDRGVVIPLAGRHVEVGRGGIGPVGRGRDEHIAEGVDGSAFPF
jgi:hypothetical protein